MDFLAKFSRLVNGMGQSLVLSWTKLVKTGGAGGGSDGSEEAAAETLAALEAKVPLLLQLLVHEDDDISANVVGFCYEYLHVLKQVCLGGREASRSGRVGLGDMTKISFPDVTHFISRYDITHFVTK